METAKHRAVRNWAAAHKKELHAQGFVLLGAPGIGKSTFVLEHYRDWVDQDEILSELGVHTKAWHTTSHSDVEEEAHYRECDAWLAIMRKCGVWVIGSLFWDPHTVDGIVLLNEEKHKYYVGQRDDLDWDKVEKIVKFLISFAKEHGIATYASIEEAAAMAQTCDQIGNAYKFFEFLCGRII